MGTVYKKTYTRPLPSSAKVTTRRRKRIAEWQDRNGNTQRAPLSKTSDNRITVESRTYTAKYRDGEGIIREQATGCRNKQAAQSILADLEKRAEKVRSNILSPSEDRIADHQQTPLTAHIDDYIAHMRQRKKNADRVKTTETRLKESAVACGFKVLRDLHSDKLLSWLAEQRESGRSASVYNGYVDVWKSFGYWLNGKRITGRKSNMLGEKRILQNPFAGLGHADDTDDDDRRPTRALTEDELRRLLDCARRRPLLDAMTIQKGPNKGKPLAKVSEERRSQLERIGYERALIYKTALLTGLRRRELMTLTVGDLDLDCAVPAIKLKSANEKSRHGSDVPLRSDLAADLRDWLADKLRRLQSQSRERGDGLPTSIPQDELVFYVPTGLLRIMNRDLKLAGIPKIDNRGRHVHLHALRHSHGTHLSKAGVTPRTAQASMRHSDVRLTMNVYTDPQLLDVAGAVESLPNLPINGPLRDEAQTAELRATGTDDMAASRNLAPNLAPTPGERGKLETTRDNSAVLTTTRQDEKNPEKTSVSRGF